MKEKFFERIKIEDDSDKLELTRIQYMIKENNNSKEFISKVIENLSDEQIQKLKELYQKDMEMLNRRIQVNKRKMMSLKAEW